MIEYREIGDIYRVAYWMNYGTHGCEGFIGNWESEKPNFWQVSLDTTDNRNLRRRDISSCDEAYKLVQEWLKS